MRVTRFNKITTDQGSHFESFLWSDFTSLLGTPHIAPLFYHPSANGMMERFHRQLKAIFAAHLTEEQWMEALPFVLFGILSALKEDCSAQPLNLSMVLLSASPVIFTFLLELLLLIP